MGRWDAEDQPTVKGDWSDVGAALAGPFDKFLPPDSYAGMRRSKNVEDRTNEEWPTAVIPGGRTKLPQTSTGLQNADDVIAFLDKIGISDIPPATRLGIDAGIHDMNLPSKEEMMKYLMVNEATGPNPPASTGYPNNMTLEEYERSIQDFNKPRVPLPRARPKGR